MSRHVDGADDFTSNGLLSMFLNRKPTVAPAGQRAITVLVGIISGQHEHARVGKFLADGRSRLLRHSKPAGIR